MILLAIDPGNNESALVAYDTDAKLPVSHGKVANGAAIERIRRGEFAAIAIEMIASYGMPVGREVFETVLWIGRFVERASAAAIPTHLVYRKDVKLHLCGTARANDANIRQALMDLYGADKTKAVGTAKAPGPLFGITKDRWAALAVARTFAETRL